jgi:1,4-dihydroxy-2-naphthoyl-CoA synthase
VGVVALTGAGERAFCVGGDQKQRELTGDYGPSETGIFEIERTALRFLKQSFNLETEQLAGQAALAFSGLREFLASPEAQEGIRAFEEKRRPNFAPFRAHASQAL